MCYGFIYFLNQTELKRALRDPVSRPLRYMKDDLHADPIMDIQLMDQESACPAGFELLKLGIWPGTTAGCLCDDGKIRGSACQNVKAEKCEKDLPRTLPIVMYEWDHSIWCLKRAVLGTDYLQRAECPAGYKECYPGGCFTKDCPITKIKIAPNGVFSVTKVQGELPVINVQVTFGDIPCFIQDLFAQTIKNSSYQLSVIKESRCDKYGLDSQFSSRLASQTAYESFTENSFSYPLLNLPYFAENANATRSVLSSKVRMKTAKHDYCLDINEALIHDFIEVSKSPWSFLCLVLVLGFRAFFLIGVFCHLAPRSQPELFEKTLIPKFSKFNMVLFSGVAFILIAFYDVYQKFHVLKADLQRYEILECFVGGQGGMVIRDFLEILNDSEAGFGLYWMLLTINIFYILIYVSSFPIVKKVFSL